MVHSWPEKLFDLSVNGPILTSHYGSSLMKLWRRKYLKVFCPSLCVLCMSFIVDFEKDWMLVAMRCRNQHLTSTSGLELLHASERTSETSRKIWIYIFHRILFLQHIEARWLTLVPALECMMICFSSAEIFFLDFLPKKKEYKATLPVSKRFKWIEGYLKNKAKVLIPITFLTECALMFNAYLLKFQSEGPTIHVLLWGA